MTLNSTTTKITYNGDGATTDFVISFVFWNSDDLRVIHRASDATETVWVEGTHYTIAGGTGSTGTLTVETAPTDYTPAAGETLTIKDYQSEVQGDSLPLSGAFPSTVVEQRLDRITRLIQIHSEEIARSILLPETSGLSGLQIPEPGAGELVRYNPSGTSLETVALGDIDTAINTLTTALATNDFLRWDNTQSAWVNITPGTTGLALFQDATAAAARTELGLGTAAVVNTGMASGTVPVLGINGFLPAVGGTFGRAVPTDKTANYAIVAGDIGQIIPFDCTAASRNPFLPLLSSVAEGFGVGVVRAAGTNPITIKQHATDGGATVVTIRTDRMVWIAKASGAWVAMGVGVDAQTFTASGTWTKPDGVTKVLIMLRGAGGSGGVVSIYNAAGGGGGGYAEYMVPAADLPVSAAVAVGAGGAATVGAGNGNPGGNTEFESFIAYGGGGGEVGNGNAIGGGGGSTGSAGNDGSSGGAGGRDEMGLNSRWKGGNGGVGDAGPGGSGFFGGGGGGSNNGGATGGIGGGSMFGGGGGGASGGSPRAPGGVSTYGGNGGSGGMGGDINGEAGTQPGGGGGAGYIGGTSGAGADGMAMIIGL